jgi:cytidylate kinase
MFSGKTTTATLLHERWGYVVVSARAVLRDLAQEALLTREELQQFGALVERETRGNWLGEAAAAVAAEHAPSPLVVDSARTRAQIGAVRRALPSVKHVHLSAPLDLLESRFAATTKGLIEPPSFERAISHPVEREAASLGDSADVVLSTEEGDPQTFVAQLMEALRGLPSP